MSLQVFMAYTGEQSGDSVKQLAGKIRIFFFFREISGYFDFFPHCASGLNKNQMKTSSKDLASTLAALCRGQDYYHRSDTTFFQ